MIPLGAELLPDPERAFHEGPGTGDIGARHGLAEAASFLGTAGKRGLPYVAVSGNMALDNGGTGRIDRAGLGRSRQTGRSRDRPFGLRDEVGCRRPCEE